MRLTACIAVAALAAIFAAPLRAAAQDLAPAQAPSAAPTPAVDPEALAALERMGADLRTLQTFEVRTATTMDMVAEDNGQRLTFSGAGLYRVQRPNAFYVEQTTDRRQRRYYYDGSTFTVYAPRMHYYAQVDAPATIAETVEFAEERYNVLLPLSDLFYWGTPEADTSDITSAQHIGFARIGDDVCDQYAFRQGEIDWQIWIQRGDRALPRKVVITSREIDGQPQFSSELTWTLNPRFDPAVFRFAPDAEARRIQIASTEE
jgi:hypothetical protein